MWLRSLPFPLPRGWSYPRRLGRLGPDLFLLSVGGALLGAAIELAAAGHRLVIRPIPVALDPHWLLVYAGLSFLRMVGAYGLALIFSVAYGYAAARSSRAERVLIPVLDVLQSIPVLSFLPAVVLAVIALVPGERLGLELASVILIFTGQAWNLAFGFYHALLTIPQDLREVAAVGRLNWWIRLRTMELPAAAIPLVWNSMMSWAGGWFFLMACEMFTLEDRSFQLPGLGSYLQVAANQGDVRALGMGIATLVAVIVLLDRLVWSPLSAWSDRFKMEATAAALPPRSAVLEVARRSRLLALLGRKVVRPLLEVVDAGLGRPAVAPRSLGPPRGLWAPRAAASLLLAGLAATALSGLPGAIRLASGVRAGQVWSLVPAAAATGGRVALALALGSAWAVPLGVALGRRHRLADRLQPIVQILASIPATALFPALLFVLVRTAWGLQVAALGVMVLASQWYILFNVLAGIRTIPEDLREVTALFRVPGPSEWRVLILPAIFPHLVTGLITAAGGCWNAAIVAEAVQFAGRSYAVTGLGATIAAASQRGDFGLLLLATVLMAALVVAIDRVVWRPLYNLAERRYHLD